MKTTLDLDARLLSEAKRRAAAAGTTLKAFVEEALRGRMATRSVAPAEYRLELPVVRGKRPPAVDVADRRALYDLLDGRR